MLYPVHLKRPKCMCVLGDSGAGGGGVCVYVCFRGWW